MPERIAVVHAAPSGAAGRHWGDTHFAASLVESLERRGMAARTLARDEWGDVGDDPVVVVRGLHPHFPAPSSRSVLWIISHPELVTDEELDAFDHVCVASSLEQPRFAERTATPVHVLHQATDPRRFRSPGVRPGAVAPGVVVVANYRWPGRRGPRWLRQLGVDYQLYGRGWARTPDARFVVAHQVPNEMLGGVYATAHVVVADQWAQMGRAGFVANRLFDVGAAGGFVVSDAGPGVDELFGDVIPTYEDRAGLAEQLDRWLHDPPGRRARSVELAAIVRGGHTFDHRAATVLDLLMTDGAAL